MLLDEPRLNRQFYEATTHDERVDFLDALFEVAAADGEIVFDEQEVVRDISLGIKLYNSHFVKAKAKALDDLGQDPV